ncbi:MAG: DUF4347 domain-containing protein [Pseudomonadota bacterium]
MRDDKPRSQTSRPVSAIALEQRMLLDGAAVATAVDVALNQDNGTADQSHVLAVEMAVSNPESLQRTGQRATDAVFIDIGVAGYETLLAGLPRDAEVFFINGNSNGFEQIANALAGDHQYRSIQIYSHGDAGELTLGADTFTSASLDGAAGHLARIGAALAPGGDILLFGCDIAGNNEGKAFVDRIAELTGADVAASDDTTGGRVALGANWDLEYQSGTVQATAVIDQRVLDAFGTALTTGWTPHGDGSLLNSDNAANDQYGYSVAIADNSGWIVVGGNAQGDIYAYRPTGGGDYVEYKLPAGSSGNGTAGSSVDVDGNFVIVGYASLNRVYIYEYVSGSNSWVQRATFTNTGSFGTDVAIQADGTNFRAVVGAPQYNSGVAGQGGAQIFYSTTSGNTWVAGSMISTNDGRDDAALNFGTSVALDGNNIVVGAPGWGYRTSSYTISGGQSATMTNVGRAYVYDWTGNVNITPAANGMSAILQPDGTGLGASYNANPDGNWDRVGSNLYFGTSVDLSVNGTTRLVAVGAPGEAGNGEAYTWANTGAGWGSFQNLVPGLAAGSQFGRSVAIDAYSNRLAVGAYNYDNGSVSGTGDGRVMMYNTYTAWANDYNLEASVGGTNLGWSVALGRDILVAGTPLADLNSTTNTGNVITLIRNSAPTAVDDTAGVNENSTVTVNVRGNDTDPNYQGNGIGSGIDGGLDVLKIVAVAQPSLGTASIVTDSYGYTRILFDANDGDFDYLSAGQTVNVSMDYTITDGGDELDIGSLSVTVTGTNDAVAVGTAVSLQVANAGAATTLFSAVNPMSSQTLKQLGAFIDPDLNDTHTYLFSNGLSTVTVAPNDGTGTSITFTINGTTGAVTFTPTLAQQGETYTIPGIRVNDGSGFATLPSFQVRIDRPNTAPTATGGTLAFTAYEDNFKAATNYSQSGTTITVNSTAHGLQVGDSVTLDFLSGTALDSTYTVVTAGANSFTVTDSVSRTTSGNALHTSVSTINTAAQFSDADAGEVLTYSLVSAPSWVSINTTTGALQIFGGNDDTATSPATFTVRATDQYGLVANKTLQITLTPVNDAPVVTNELVNIQAYIGQTYANTDVGAIVKLPSSPTLFTDIDLPTANTFTLSAAFADGRALGSVGVGSWLAFDAANGRFYTTGPVTGEIGTVLSMRITATDNGTPPMSRDYLFDISVFPQPQSTGPGTVGGSNVQAGYAVSVSEDGLWMVVGEPQYGAAGTDIYRGRVSIYNWSGTAWVLAQTLADPSPADNERFGYAVDINADGTRIVIGAPGTANGGSADAGAVYSYTRVGGSNAFGVAATTYTATAGDRQAGDLFGTAVALDRTGTRFVVGAPGDDSAGTEAGAVYLFTFGTATELAKRLAVADSGETVGSLSMDRFGSSLDFDGNLVVVGAPFDSSGGKFFNGSATLLGVGASAFNGNVVKYTGATSLDFFGWDVALDLYRANSGAALNSSVTVAVGAPGSDIKDTDAGAVYTYRSNAMTDTVTQANLNGITALETITAYDGVEFGRFGLSVAVDAQNATASYANDVADNGIRMAVGANVDGVLGGTTYLYRDWTSITGNGWIGERFTSPNGGLYSEAQFGWAVAINNAPTSAWNAAYAVAANGGRLTVGAPETDLVRTGTYTRAGTTITINFTAHGLQVGQQIYADFTGGGTDNLYTITSVAANSFTVTDTATGAIASSAVTFSTRYTSSGAFFTASSVSTPIETTPAPKSQSVDKWLTDPSAPAPASVSTPFEDDEERDARYASLGVLSPAGIGESVPAPVTVSVAGSADVDPLLFLLQMAGNGQEAAVAAPEGDTAPEENAPAENGEKTTRAEAAPALSQQLQMLNDRHARAAGDLLARLEGLTA